jgi:isochorismate synthase
MLRKRGDNFDSCPLAGTMEKNERNIGEGQKLIHSVKNLHEHRLVIRAIRDILSERSISLSIPDKPSLINTTNLWHLATKISGEVKNRKENALSLACSLHPTPALSGFPHRQAWDLICQLEPFDRYLFGGIVGWIDDRGNGEWVVIIRCGMIKENSARLFAGSGIVVSSDPEEEWQETLAKLKMMLKAFSID